jgi:hypothetical protein
MVCGYALKLKDIMCKNPEIEDEIIDEEADNDYQ